MSGLVKILDKINSEAKSEADRLAKESLAKVETIKEQNQEKITKEIAKIEETRLKERKLLEDRIISNGELDARNIVLAKKQDILSEVYNEVLEELTKIDDNDYVDFVKRKISKEDGVVVLQEGRKEAVLKALPKVTVIEDKVVSSGFIEELDSIENNYTFEALLHIERDESQMELAKILFEK